jgi:E3 ubiquitin-protein ligase UBR1
LGTFKPWMKLDTDWDALPILLAGTITAMEIAQRGSGEGIGAELHPPVLGALSSQDLMILRVLAETVRTMIVFREESDRLKQWKKIHPKYFGRMVQLIPLNEMKDTNETDLPTVLKSDLFERFVVSCGLCSPAFGIGVGRLLLIHYIAEITKIVLAILMSETAVKFILSKTKWPKFHDSLPLGPRTFLKYLTARLEREPLQMLLDGLYRLTQRFILPFLRKAVIFTHVYEGVAFNSLEHTEEIESDRLCRLLGLPTLADVLDTNISANMLLSSLIQNWTNEGRSYYPGFRAPLRLEELELHHPAVFELIGLPSRLDVLLELASKYHCPECSQVPDEPAMCLFCGEIVCAQTRCCFKQGYGEMNHHRKRCDSK